MEWRRKAVNRNRDGGAVEAVTAAGNKADALRLLGWLKQEKDVTPALGMVHVAPGSGRTFRAHYDVKVLKDVIRC